MSQVNKLKQHYPTALNNDEIRALAMDADELHDIKSIGDTPAGETLINLLQTDLAGRIGRLEATYKTATHTELIAVCADLSANLQLLRLLLNAEANEQIVLDALEDALA